MTRPPPAQGARLLNPSSITELSASTIATNFPGLGCIRAEDCKAWLASHQAVCVCCTLLRPVFSAGRSRTTQHDHPPIVRLCLHTGNTLPSVLWW